MLTVKNTPSRAGGGGAAANVDPLEPTYAARAPHTLFTSTAYFRPNLGCGLAC